MFDNIKPVTLSSRAAEEVRKIMLTKNIPAGYALRVAVKGGGGCGGATLIIGFDKPKVADLIYEEDDVKIIIDKKHMLYLMGKQVDFYEGADAKGFIFAEQD